MRKTIGASESSSIYLFGICAGSILSIFLSLLLRNSTATLDGMSVFSWCGYAIMQIAFIATVIIYSSLRKVDIITVGKIRGKLNVWQILLIPFISIATILVFLPLANLWGTFLSVIGYHGAVVSMPAYSNVGIYFLSLFVMAILPALGEELLMRGAVLPGLSTRNVWFGVLMSGLFFSLMHANPVQTVHQFGLGVVLALVLILSGSIWAGVILHFFNNFISITLTAYLPQVDEIYISLGAYNWLTGFASVVVGVFALAVLLYLFYRAGNKRASGEVHSVYEEGGFTIVASATSMPKQNVFKGFILFFKSLFTKAGWRKITYELEECNRVEYIGKNQQMSGVWIALGLVIIYWLFNFIEGII